MSIVGLGADLVDISRIADLRRRYETRFLHRVFHSAEIEDCFSRKEPDRHLAARFAAKEAWVKALGIRMLVVPLREIRVIGGNDIPPKIEMSGRVLQQCHKKGIDKLHLSLSHEGNMALAVVIAERSESS